MIQKNRVRAVALAAFAALLSVPAAAAQAQSVITGKVQAESGAPIEGANVIIADVNVSVGTNSQGIYTTTIPAARVSGQQVVVRVRAIGYAPESRTISLTAGTHTENFTMKQDVNRLSEVVVTGTAGGEGVERAKVPYAIARLTDADIPIPALDPVRALQGKIPGVRISATNGAPGSTPQILMRGPTSINAQGRSQQPLIVVDGAIMRNANLDELGGLDIESVEVVKGAAGSTLYGSTAASGVINIKTKRGSARDGISFNIRSEVGFSDPNSTNWGIPTNHPLQLDETGTRFCVVGSASQPACSKTFEWNREFQRINGVVGDTTRTAQQAQFASPGLASGDLLNVFQANVWPGQYYDAYAALATRDLNTINSVDASGRVGGVRFFASGQYTDNQGAIRGGQTNTNSRARVNLDYDMRDDLLIQVSTAFNKGITMGSNPDFFAIFRGLPPGTNVLARDTLNRTFVVVGGGGSFRPTGNGATGLFNNQEWSGGHFIANRFLGNLQATYNPAQWVTLGGSFAYDNRQTTSQGYDFKGYRTRTFSTAALGSMGVSDAYNEAMNGNVNATFRHSPTSDLNTKLSLSALGDQAKFSNNAGGGDQFIVKDVFTLSNTSTNKTATSSSQMDRNLGFSGALNADYKDRYILEGALRYDGSSRFGAGNRWAPFSRVSGVWRVSQEPFFNVPGMTDFRLRASRGTAGNTPSFNAQYETYACGTAGCSLGQAGNKLLKPETTTEVELGSDMTLFDRLGLELTYVKGVSRNQILNVPTPYSVGFATQWQNAGTLENTTWEVGASLPVITRRDFNWSMRGTWDRTRTYITELFMPEYFTNGGTGQGTGSLFLMTADPTVVDGFPKNRYGNMWGRRFYESCDQMPAIVQVECGEGKAYQMNDQGHIVWVGAGNSWKDGITKNLWQSKLSAADSPWNYPLYFGHPIIDRPLRGEDGAGTGENHIIGNTLPDFRISYGNNIQYKKLTLYGLIDGTFGHEINNQTEGWGLLDMSSGYFDQSGATVETAKPVGYSWRVGGSEGAGSGGFYDILGPNSYNVETGSYAKLRELTLSYRLGRIPSIGGDWTLGLVGRNLYTWTKYTGIDPETGAGAGTTGSGLINQTDQAAYPTLRTFTLSFSTRY
ncbi:MAG TPA: SusC/RagA family TonB-linked outer membrane protein [Gemmatimonadaceae bacterium]|nr:SusC/RagA family TonB-linked outer membrane protein [Gemmatimonadaceae bacterium]